MHTEIIDTFCEIDIYILIIGFSHCILLRVGIVMSRNE